MDFGVRPRDKTPNSVVAHANSPRLKKARMSKCKIKSILIFLTVRGSSTRKLCHQDKLSIKLFVGKSMKDSPCHKAVFINEFLAGKKIPVFPQPSYSPDLSLCDFFLFPRIKTHLKGRHFGTLDNIRKSATDELKGIPAEAFQHCYEQWKQRLRRCVAAQGNYFEGENLDL